MKTKNIAIIILAALLAVASVLAAMWYPAGNDEDTTEASGQPDEIMKDRMANELLISNAKAHYTYEGTKLDDFTITAIPSGEQALFSSILDGRYRLVFKTSPLNCPACINAELGNVIIQVINHLHVNAIAFYSTCKGNKTGTKSII